VKIGIVRSQNTLRMKKIPKNLVVWKNHIKNLVKSQDEKLWKNGTY
jgi:hypothetical protein